MDTKLLSIFQTVAERGGFAPAARSMDMDPSAISRAVAALEDDLGARLFQRTTRRVVLTDAGERFLARVEPILSELDEARDDLQETEASPKGPLTITASVGFGQVCLMPLVPAFLEAYPGIDLTLRFTDTPVDLIGERVDLALRHGPTVTGDFIVAKLMETQYRVCATPAYLETSEKPTEPEDLQNHRCLCFAMAGYDTEWRFRTGPAAATRVVPIAPRMRVTGAIALREAALAGLGPALLPSWVVDEDIRAGRLIDLLPAYQATASHFDTAVWLVYPSRSFLPRKTRVMIDFLRSRLA